MTKSKIFFRYFILILCCIVIFCFSAQNGSESTSESDRIFNIVKAIFYPDYNSMTSHEQFVLKMNLTHYIRKTAHFLVYTCLGFLAFSALFQIKSKKRRIIFSVIFCCFYACTDELHQNFVSGRTPLAGDVLIDTCGGLLGASLALLFSILIFRYQDWKSAEKALSPK